MKNANKKGFRLDEQAILWIAAFLVCGVAVTHLPFGESETFKVVPDFMISVTNALGIVLLSYGIWALWRAKVDKADSVGTTAFLLPFLGIGAWTVPFLAEAIFR